MALPIADAERLQEDLKAQIFIAKQRRLVHRALEAGLE
jgi:hypothetical protein